MFHVPDAVQNLGKGTGDGDVMWFGLVQDIFQDQAGEDPVVSWQIPR